MVKLTHFRPSTVVKTAADATAGQKSVAFREVLDCGRASCRFAPFRPFNCHDSVPVISLKNHALSPKLSDDIMDYMTEITFQPFMPRYL